MRAIERMGNTRKQMIHLNCGHDIENLSNANEVKIHEYDTKGYMCTVCLIVCVDCLPNYLEKKEDDDDRKE